MPLPYYYYIAGISDDLTNAFKHEENVVNWGDLDWYGDNGGHIARIWYLTTQMIRACMSSGMKLKTQYTMEVEKLRQGY